MFALIIKTKGGLLRAPAGWLLGVVCLLTASPRCCRVMLDSVTHSSTFLPNTSFCDPLMSWTDLFSNEEYYPTFEHQTGTYIWRRPSELRWAGAESDVGLGQVTSTCWGTANVSSHQCSVQRARGGLGRRQGSS